MISNRSNLEDNYEILDLNNNEIKQNKEKRVAELEKQLKEVVKEQNMRYDKIKWWRDTDEGMCQ